jgi:N-acetylglucosaminyl-diphospho-decaprenol L-rhamnosyltransferase
VRSGDELQETFTNRRDQRGSSDLDVVVVSYRCRELLGRCLASLFEHAPERRMSVYVVDNGSRDGTVDMVARSFPAVELIPLDENAGFSRANNIAIVRGSGEFVLVLNPDTRMMSGALDRLLEVMDARPEIGICGCRLELEDGTFDHAAKRSFPTPISALGHFSGIGRRERAAGHLAAYRAPSVDSGPVDAVNGAFMLIRRGALDDVGLFDEGYWMYMEDLDLCYRFAQAGWVTWYDPTVTVMHVKAGTSGKHRRFRLNFAFHYGMYRFYRKHYASDRTRFLNGAIYAGIAAKLGLSLIRSAVQRRVLAVGRSGRRRMRSWLEPRDRENQRGDAERGEDVRIRGARRYNETR